MWTDLYSHYSWTHSRVYFDLNNHNALGVLCLYACTLCSHYYFVFHVAALVANEIEYIKVERLRLGNLLSGF